MSRKIPDRKPYLTQIQVTKATRKRLQVFKAEMQVKTYDDAIKFLLDEFGKMTPEQIEKALRRAEAEGRGEKY